MAATTVGQPATTAQHRAPAKGNPFLPLLLDVAVPLASYYLMRHFGVPLVTALAISGLVPAVRVVWSMIRDRAADGLAVGVVALTVVSIPLAFVTGSPKLLLAKDSLGTGTLGVWLIISAVLARPAMSNGIRAFLARTEGSAAAWDELASGSAAFRACLKAATLVWGVGFIVECVGRIALVVALPINTAVWAVNIVPAVVLTSCVFVQGRWVMRMARMIGQRVAENDQVEPLRPALAA
ncbi:MAG TPA: VC0807 family protein [Pseudonocardiaceae bacterium]|nr:VC0807 family protein [Pseudonocardiaceae bacterium]